MNIFGKVGLNGLKFGKRNAAVLNKNSNKRYFERFCNTLSPKSFDIAKEKAAFYDALPRVIDGLTNHSKFEDAPTAKEWMKKVINGTVTGGKLTRGLTTVISYKTVENPENINEETIRLAHSLGWCTEILHAYCVVLDDIMDRSTTRRGMPCWYRNEDVGMVHALNDSILLICSLHQVLRNNFEKSPIYVNLYQTYHECLLLTCIGQYLDVKGSEHKKKYDSFTSENYDAIVKYKCSFYTYFLPISVGMTMANKLNAESLKNCEEISFLLGRLFQMQDDYIDCFGDNIFTGKIGTDIEEGKCSWLAVSALSRCNDKKRAVFIACYGSKEPAHVERIKQLYIQLQIPQLYKQEELEIYNKIKQKIETISSQSERDLYENVLDMTYNRKK